MANKDEFNWCGFSEEYIHSYRKLLKYYRQINRLRLKAFPQEKSWKFWKGFIRKFNDISCVVYKHENEVIAFTYKIIDDNYDLLLYIIVDERYRDKGIGSYIFNSELLFAQDNYDVPLYLYVDKNNYNVKKWFNHKGFFSTGYVINEFNTDYEIYAHDDFIRLLEDIPGDICSALNKLNKKYIPNIKKERGR